MRKYRGAEIEPGLASGAFEYWEDGNSPVMYNHPIEGDYGSVMLPYVVRASSKSWIPVNVLVFAASEDHAVGRVIESLKECVKRDYHQVSEKHRLAAFHFRGKKVLEAIKSGELVVEVEPYPVGLISKIAWASNDTVT